jgi:murein DD-endopeptidase MepM/ murein hydrolase activator NlpD
MKSEWMSASLKILVFFVLLWTIGCAPTHSVYLRKDTGNDPGRRGSPDMGHETLSFQWTDEESAKGRQGNDFPDLFVEYRDENRSPGNLRESNNQNENSSREGKDGRVVSRSSNEAAYNATPQPSARKMPPLKGRRELTGSGVYESRGFVRYRVKKKDTLYGISRRYNVGLDDLCRYNNRKEEDHLVAGTILKIPRIKNIYRRVDGPVAGPGSARKRLYFSWPVRPVVSVKRDAMKGVRPSGIRITGKEGSSVISSAGGVVEKIGEMRGYGTYVIISHADRFVTVYANVKDVKVAEGQKVPGGRTIAEIGGNDNTLYFQIGREGRPVDPFKYLPGKS